MNPIIRTQRIGLGAYEPTGIEPSESERALRQKVAIGSLVGGVALFFGGQALATATKYAGLAGVAYGVWLQLNLNTTRVLPWEQSR